jgi:hypothetical protein
MNTYEWYYWESEHHSGKFEAETDERALELLNLAESQLPECINICYKELAKDELLVIYPDME